jgi:ABC-2 type transport system permease protein
MLIYKFKAFFKKDFLLERNNLIDNLVGFLANFLFAIVFYFIAKLVNREALSFSGQYGSDYFSFVFIGIIFIWYIHMILNNFSKDIKEYWLGGKLEFMISTPTEVPVILLGMNLWNIFLATLYTGVFLFLGKYFLGVKINNPDIFACLLILLLAAFISVSVGIISSSLSILFFKKREPVVFLFHCVVSLLCGVYFPINLLPQSLQKLSYVLPMTYALRGLRKTLLEKCSINSLFTDLTILVISLVIFLPVSFMVFNYTLRKAKIEGRFSYG